jgi:Cu-Zn family superoxide dismutase
MRRLRLPIASFAAAAVILTGCGTTDTGSPDAEGSSQPPGPAQDEGALEVTMIGGQGAEAGTVRLVPEGDGVRVEARLEGLEPGYHGFHLHDVGACDASAPDGPFTTAMGHYVGGAGGVHGAHDGDMPSLYAKADGSASLTASLDAFTLEEVTEGDGSAVMVHAGADNFANIPDRYTSSDSGQPGPDEMTTKTGDAGARAACGVIKGAGA